MFFDKKSNGCVTLFTKFIAVFMSVILFCLLTGAVIDVQTKRITLVMVDAFADTEKTRELTTRQNLVGEFLSENEVEIGEFDKVSMLYEDELYDEARIIVRKGRKFTLNIDGNIEIIVATHPDADHIGGMDDVLKKYTVDRIIDSGYTSSSKTYSDYIDAVKNEGCTFEYDTDLTIDIDHGVMFNIIETGDDWDNSNNMSVVSYLVYGNTKIVFTGDIRQKVETEILDKFFMADVLKVAHHGSKTSTSSEFLQIVKPAYAVISAAKDNKYGHPTQETLQRISSIGAKVLGTYDSENIILNITKIPTNM